LTLKLNRTSVMWGGLFLFFFALSLALFLLFADNHQEVVLFFPNDSNHRLTGESRVIPRHGTIEENLTTLVDGLILGPEKLQHDRALPRATQIRSLMLRKGVLYIDFSPDILFPEQETSLGFIESLTAVKKTITFNYPEIDRILITVDGQEPKSEIHANN